MRSWREHGCVGVQADAEISDGAQREISHHPSFEDGG
jgi:hypothetical protein